MRFKKYSKSQLESMADELNKGFDPERLQMAKPVDVYDVVSFVGADTDWKNLSLDGSILGATIFTDGKLLVFEDEDGVFKEKIIEVEAGTIIIDSRVEDDDNKGRRNFTVMHEVFHFLYHKRSFARRNGGVKKVLETQIPRSYDEMKNGMTGLEILEWQANYMAASFLIPRLALIKEVNRIKPNAIADLKNIVLLNLGEESTRKLAKKFSVSHKTMVYRLIGLEMI